MSTKRIFSKIKLLLHKRLQSKKNRASIFRQSKQHLSLRSILLDLEKKRINKKPKGGHDLKKNKISECNVNMYLVHCDFHHFIFKNWKTCCAKIFPRSQSNQITGPRVYTLYITTFLDLNLGQSFCPRLLYIFLVKSLGPIYANVD